MNECVKKMRKIENFLKYLEIEENLNYIYLFNSNIFPFFILIF